MFQCDVHFTECYIAQFLISCYLDHLEVHRCFTPRDEFYIQGEVGWGILVMLGGCGAMEGDGRSPACDAYLAELRKEVGHADLLRCVPA